MSITAPDDRISIHNPVSPTTDFPAEFPVFNDADLSVYHNGVLRVDFTVTATYDEGISTDAKVIFSPGISGNVIVVGDRLPRRQNRFSNGGPLPIWAQNLALDTITSELQEVKRDLRRAVLAYFGSEGLSLDGDLAEGETVFLGPNRTLTGGLAMDQIVDLTTLASLLAQKQPLNASLTALSDKTIGAKGLNLLASSTSAAAINALGGAGGTFGNSLISDLDAAKLTGIIDPARLPVLPGNTQVMSSGDIADLTTMQQAIINQGTLVTTMDGRRWVYTGAGSKLSEASYIVLADVTPEWAAISNKPAFGTASLLNIGMIAGTVAAGDDTRILGALQRTGGTMTGNILMSKATPLFDLQGTSSAPVYFRFRNTVGRYDIALDGGGQLRFNNHAADGTFQNNPLTFDDGGNVLFESRPIFSGNGSQFALLSDLASGSYKGTWNANTNSPAITSSVGANGDFYIVATAGSTSINGINTWIVGDTIRFNGSAWQKIPSTASVSSVAGKTGAVTLNADDVATTMTKLWLTDTERTKIASAVLQTGQFATTGIVSKVGLISNGATANSIIGDPGDGSPITSALFATADLPFYSVGGYVTGPHMFGANILTMRTTRDENAQEQVLAIQFINETGQPPGGGTSINNGKSGLTVHGRAVAGGGNMWGAAIAVDIEGGYDYGSVYAVEIDLNNRNKNSVIGGDFNACGLMMNSISHYSVTTYIWMTSNDAQPNPTGLYGLFISGENTIGDSTIMEDTASNVVLKINGIGTEADSGKNAHGVAIVQNLSTSPYLLLDQGYHQNATIRDESVAPVGLDIAGTKGAFAARFTDNAPIGLSVQGTRSAAAIDVSQATTPNGLIMASNQIFAIGQFQIYNDPGGNKLRIRRASDAANLFSVDTSGNLRTLGTITPAVAP